MKQLQKYRTDLIVLAGLALIGLFLGLGLLLFGQQGGQVQVRVGGEAVATWPLSRDGTYTIEGIDGGTNILVIQDGRACITEASCPDGLCVGMGWISRSGQSIVCLPNQVVVEILSDGTDGEDMDVDGVAG
ncbi:MAG: NusG domain II-containing protein [Lachnospiraceae bacterium]|nr:NusG domain II-containing protein [Lachnospiraceae bacterium]